MKAKVAKWMLSSLGTLLLLALLAAGLVYWQLQQGPVRLPLLEPQVRSVLDESLRASGLRVDFRDVVVEIDRRRHLPALRLRDLTLREAGGRQLASAPRASISLSGKALLGGSVRVEHLELVGPQLTIVRDAAGIRIGIERQAEQQAESGGIPEGAAGRQQAHNAAPDAAVRPEDGNARAGGDILRTIPLRPDMLTRDLGGLSSLRIVDAKVVYRDEPLGLLWKAPNAELELRRVPYGFALMGQAHVLGPGGVLPVSLSASWRQREKRLDVSLQMTDVELGALLEDTLRRDLPEELKLPLSGRMHLQLAADGRLRAASGELLLGRGMLSWPDWLAQPLALQEGLLRLDYDPAEGSMKVRHGVLQLATGRASLSGWLKLVRAGANGTASALAMDLRLQHGPGKRAARDGKLLVREIRLQGSWRLGQGRLDIADLQLAGDAGAARLRGVLRREPEGLGIYVSGRAQDISHEMLKAMWPPRLGAGARAWVRQHVLSGSIPQASMQLAIPARILKAAVERDVPMPEKVADIRFSLRDVRFTHVEGWPAVEKASGEGRMSGNTFRLRLQQGRSRLPSGRVLTLKGGELQARDLAAKVSPGSIEIEATGAAESFLELADLPPLRLRRMLGMDKGGLQGDAGVSVRLTLPFYRELKAQDINVAEVKAFLRKGRVSGLAEGFGLQAANLRFTYAKGTLKARGTARMGSVPVKLTWQRDMAKAAAGGASLQLQARLDDAMRRRLGVDLSPWMSGPMDVRADVALAGSRMRNVKVRADLSRVRMQLPAIGWKRAARKGTSATFEISLPGTRGKGALQVRNLQLRGPGGLRVEGRVRLDGKGGFREATFSRFELDANNRLALGLDLAGQRLNVVAAGPSFDARALITRMFAPRREIDRSLHSVFVRVNVKKVLALRGEAIMDVRGEVELRNGLVRRAVLTGRFASGRKVALDLVPAREGLRRLRIASEDAGALLRASGLYSRIIGGKAEFTALLKSGDDGGVQRGLLILRRFTVRGDARLSRVQQRSGRKARGGPRRGQRFKKLVLPFSTDRNFIRIGDAIIRSPEIGATANGIIRRTDGAMDIGGTIIPAYALNAAFGKIPVLGALLTGGRGQGVFGITYALKGSMNRPKFLVNPVSAVAPGVFRQLFQMGGHNVNPDGTPRRRKQPERRQRSRTNIANGG